MLMKNEYFFLSNFYPCLIQIEIGNKLLTFNNAEAAFQAQKNISLSDKFCLLKGLEAKTLGEQIEITTENWDIYQIFAMAYVLCTKFSHSELFKKLQEIREPIIQDNYWGDTFWGVCKGVGKNIFGKLLTYIKDKGPDLTAISKYITEILVKEIL